MSVKNQASSSRAARNPISFAANTKISFDSGKCIVTNGSKSNDVAILEGVNVSLNEENKIVVCETASNFKSYAGTTARNIMSAIKGVEVGFEKVLLLTGVGYKSALKGDSSITLTVGKSHPVDIAIPSGLNVECKDKEITIKGHDSYKVSQFAHKVASERKFSIYGYGCIKIKDYKYPDLKGGKKK